LIFAVPYLHLSSAYRFVLVDVDEGISVEGDAPPERVVGYIVGSTDRRIFDQDAAENWWPKVQAQYPHPPDSDKEKYSDAEWHYFKMIAHPRSTFPQPTPQEVLEVYPAYVHINLLEPYRGKGWGSKLVKAACEAVKEAGGKGLFIGLDPRNNESRKFYLAVGFERLPTPKGEYYGLDIDKFLKRGKEKTA